MREIKFRQYMGDRFHYWGFIESGIFFGPANKTSSEEQQENSQQFTGLKDKNGLTEIYEGDICWDSVNEEYGEVYFDKGAFYYRHENIIELLNEVNDSIEVIGNIYENPKLIKAD
jgi:hypothetical protein